MAQSTCPNAPPPRWLAPLLIGLFFALSLALLLNYRRAHWDEHFYTQGAVAMTRTGDFWHPTWPDGTYRFNKPIVTYWILYASYLLFGISSPASQIPFLLVACGTLAITYALAKRFYQSSSAGLLALSVLLSNFEFFRISSCSITDGILAFAAIISHFGFLNLLLRDKRSWGLYACAWLGLGLGVTTKGWVGGIPLIFVVGYSIVLGRPLENFKKVVHVPFMLAGGALGTAWMALMLWMHGQQFTDKILNDQVGRRLEDSTFLTNAWFYPSITLFEFLPALLPLFFAAILNRAAVARAFRQVREVWIYAGLALGLQIFLFTPGNQARVRYLLPVYPLMAVALAGWLNALDPALLYMGLRKTIRFAACVFMAVAILAGLMLSTLDSRIMLGAELIAAVCIAAFAATFFTRALAPVLALLFLGAVAAHDGLIEGTLQASPAPRIAARILKNAPNPSNVVIATQTMMPLGSQVLVSTHGHAYIYYSLKDHPNPDALVFTDRERARFDLSAYDTQPVATTYYHFDPFEGFLQWRKGNWKPYVEKSKRDWFLALRKP